MKISKAFFKKPVLISTVLGTLAGGGLVWASQGGGDHLGCHGRYGGGFHKGWSNSDEHIDGKIAFVKTELQITQDQEQAWNEFEQVMREAAQSRSEMFAKRHKSKGEKSDEMELKSLDKRIDTKLAMMEQRHEMLRTVALAAKDLYAELNPEQKAIADKLLRKGRGWH